MIPKFTSSANRRPAPRRVLPHVLRRSSWTDRNEAGTIDALAAHWDAMQQAMAATADLRH